MHSRFNPHPARGPGESTALDFLRKGSAGFNPHPARGPGESRTRFEQGSRRAGVSIRTRPEGRVNRRVLGRGGSVDSGFNPHPARGPGESDRSRRRLLDS